MKATYIDLINHFWAENRRERFGPCETLLYLYLLNEANAARWEMPIAVPTEVICSMLGKGKDSILRDRKNLAERGMIKFTPGQLKVSSPSYSLTDQICETRNATTSATTNATTLIDIDINKNKDIDKEKNKEKDKKVVPSLPVLSKNSDDKEEIRQIDELKAGIEVDKVWLDEVCCQFPDLDILHLLSDFTSMLRLRGENRKTASDFRSHFINWIIKNQRHENNKSNPDRRATPAANCRQKDYDAPFMPAL